MHSFSLLKCTYVIQNRRASLLHSNWNHSKYGNPCNLSCTVLLSQLVQTWKRYLYYASWWIWLVIVPVYGCQATLQLVKLNWFGVTGVPILAILQQLYKRNSISEKQLCRQCSDIWCGCISGNLSSNLCSRFFTGPIPIPSMSWFPVCSLIVLN